MNKFFLVAGIVLSVGPFFLMGDKLDAYRVQQHGRVVWMEVIDIPSSFLANGKFIKVGYNKKIFLKKVGRSFCEAHAVGDVVEFKYLAGAENILLPNESVIGQFISMALIVLVGMYCVFKGLKKET
jgi:hypothetical protein